MRVFLAVAIVATFATRAFAQAPGETAPQPVAMAKDPGIATGLSLGITFAAGVGFAVGVGNHNPGIALGALAGLYLAPSSGHWYAGDLAATGLGIRTLGALGMLSGIVMIMDSDHGDCIDLTGPQCQALTAQEHSDQTKGGLVLLGGLAVFVGGAVYDIVTAGSAARRYNREHASVQPTMITSAGHHAPGLALTGTF